MKGIPRSEGMSQRIIENYDFFKSKINKENVVAIYSGVQRLFVVDVALEKEKDNPQLIFESMNSTGLDLSQADLIRNYVLMGQEVRLQTSLYESYCTLWNKDMVVNMRRCLIASCAITYQ